MSSAKIGSMIAASAQLGLKYAQRLSGDVPAEKFASLARIGDTVIDANHPAFIFGHLALYPTRIITQLGGDGTKYAPTAEDEKLFSHQAKCLDDPEATLYPHKDVLVARLIDSTLAAIEALEAADDSLFRPENPNEAMRSKFPSIGAMHGFYVGGHFMLHMGQLSTWRRVMGLGPA
jgi:hypothetical protein